MISYPETEQFRNVITTVNKYWPQYEKHADKGFPRMTFIGTVKLHGTNSAIVFNKEQGYWLQSRNNILRDGRDNAGFAAAMNPIVSKFLDQHVLPNSEVIRNYYEEGRTIIIYGEWCGQNIQKNVAISSLPRMFVIFKVRIMIDQTETSDDENDVHVRRFWLKPEDWSNIYAHNLSIYNIFEFPTYKIEIDFRAPQRSQNDLVEITNKVEERCPVGAHFGVSGIGEGVVWTEWEQTLGSLLFKVKGEKHSVSKVKTLAPISVENMNNINEFVDYACTENRMEQALDYLKEQGLQIEMKNFSVFLKWLNNDIVKEEKDTMDQANIAVKDLNTAVAKRAKLWFQSHST